MLHLRVLFTLYQIQKGKYMSQQHQKWIQLVKDKLNSEGMTKTHLARACGVKKPTISELLKYGKGSDRLKNRVCDVLGIDESWVDLGE
jgi:gp8